MRDQERVDNSAILTKPVFQTKCLIKVLNSVPILILIEGIFKKKHFMAVVASILFSFYRCYTYLFFKPKKRTC